VEMCLIDANQEGDNMNKAQNMINFLQTYKKSNYAIGF